MKETAPPIIVTYEQLKDMINVGGVDNLADEIIYDLLLLIPCFVMHLRQRQVDAMKEYKLAKAVYQKTQAIEFLKADGKSVEVKKAQASVVEATLAAEHDMISAEVEYERIKDADTDWLELQQALKRIIDGRVKK